MQKQFLSTYQLSPVTFNQETALVLEKDENLIMLNQDWMEDVPVLPIATYPSEFLSLG